MKITSELLGYLDNTNFSNGETFHFNEKIYPENRIDYLRRLVHEKKVIHIGCLDHVPLISEKINSGNWLHKILTESAHECIGFDIDLEGIKYVSENFSFDNIFLEDITNHQSEKIIKEKWDYIILGELLEHIDNPIDFLKKIVSHYSGYINKVIITVPNILVRSKMKAATKCCEIINTDHRYWFTPYTILKVATMSGLKPVELTFKNRESLTFAELVKRKILEKTFGKKISYPFFYYSSLVLTCEFPIVSNKK